MKFIILLLLPIFGFAQTKLEQKVSILDQRVELLVPKELSKMTAEIWKLKYGNVQQPILSLSDKDVDVNLVGQFTNQKWEENNLAEYKDFRINNFKKTRTDVQILEEGVKDINGRKVGFLKFMSQARDVKIFNYYFFTIVDEKIFLFNFNCSEASRSTWEKTADQIVASLKTK